MQVSPLKEVLFGRCPANLATRSVWLWFTTWLNQPQRKEIQTHRYDVASSLFLGFQILRQFNNLHYSHILESSKMCNVIWGQVYSLSNSDYNLDSYFGNQQRQREQVDFSAVTEPSLQTEHSVHEEEWKLIKIHKTPRATSKVYVKMTFSKISLLDMFRRL